MKFAIVAFDPAHIDMLDVQDAQRIDAERRAVLSSDYGRAWTAEVDGEPIACAGLIEVWEGRAYAWALIGRNAGPWMAAITRAVRRALDVAPFRRVEMAVDATFEAGNRWALLLGFTRETDKPLRCYLPSGDAYLYARVT